MRVEVEGLEIDARAVAKDYGVELVEAEVVPVGEPGTRSIRLLKNRRARVPVYILETPHLLKLISLPHISGERASRLLKESVHLLLKVIKRFKLERFGKVVKFPSSPLLEGLPLPEVSEARGDFVLITSPETLLNEDSPIHEVVDNGRAKIVLVIGLISKDAVAKIERRLDKVGSSPILITTIFMPDSFTDPIVYGPDVEKLSSGRFIVKGGTIDLDTFTRLLPNYPPGCPVSIGWERFRDEGLYLRKIMDRLVRIMEVPVLDPWQMEIVFREAKLVMNRLLEIEAGGEKLGP